MINEKIYIEEVKFFDKITSIDSNNTNIKSGGFCGRSHLEKKNRAGGGLCSNFIPGGIGCFSHYNGVGCAGVMSGVFCFGTLAGFICNNVIGGVGCNGGVGGFACNVRDFGGLGCNIILIE